MIKATSAAAMLTAILGTGIADAQVLLRFVESAPKDSFHIENRGTCETGKIDLVIDLSKSAGRLIFDVTDSGAGVEVYQPFQLVAGADRVESATPLKDGDNMAHLTLLSLQPGDRVAFTIDVDDTLNNSELGQIRVSGSEIAGATATIMSNGTDAVSGVFGADGNADVSYRSCTS